MNYQQRNRALSECIRVRCERTVYNLYAGNESDINYSPNPSFILDFCSFETLNLGIDQAVNINPSSNFRFIFGPRSKKLLETKGFQNANICVAVFIKGKAVAFGLNV